MRSIAPEKLCKLLWMLDLIDGAAQKAEHDMPIISGISIGYGGNLISEICNSRAEDRYRSGPKG
jgi:hypothetical protein